MRYKKEVHYIIYYLLIFKILQKMEKSVKIQTQLSLEDLVPSNAYEQRLEASVEKNKLNTELSKKCSSWRS